LETNENERSEVISEKRSKTVKYDNVSDHNFWTKVGDIIAISLLLGIAF
jgi:hypothetical protein